MYDVGRVEDRAYLVAELLEGETLRMRVARGPIATEEVVRIAAEIARSSSPRTRPAWCTAT